MSQNRAAVHRAYFNTTPEKQYLSAILSIAVPKGPEQWLPLGLSFLDKGGHKRQDVRLRWWDPLATTFRQATIGMDDRLGDLPDVELPIVFRYLESTPVLLGHYWMECEPKIKYPTVACLDFGVARSGYLTAYRCSGERELLSENLVHVPAEV